jgi:hypothetical protein
MPAFSRLRLRGAYGIEIGGIEKVDPRVSRGVEDAVRFLFVGLLSESRRAKAQVRNGHTGAAKPRELHSAKSFGLNSRQAAVDRKVDAGDVAALVGGEEHGYRRDLIRTSRSAQREPRDRSPCSERCDPPCRLHEVFSEITKPMR